MIILNKIDESDGSRGNFMATVKLKGNLVNTNGELPGLNTKAIDFRLVDRDLKDRSLGEFKGKRKLISIVPSLDTDVCSLSTRKFNEIAKKHPNVLILVVSSDLPFAQKRFCNSEHVQNVVTLSIMRSKKFAEDYGVLLKDGSLAGITARAVLVLDENDNVIYTELVPEISEEPDYEKATAILIK